MKKKLMLAIALIAVMAISVAVLAGCKPDIKPAPTPAPVEIKTVEEFIAKADGATCLSVTMDNQELKISGATYYDKRTKESDIAEMYIVTEGNEATKYEGFNGEWEQYTETISTDEAAWYTAKGFFKGSIETDASQYNIADGVWTLKTDSAQTLSMSKGKLVYSYSETSATMSLDNITLTVPDAAKNAPKMIRTVEDFIAKLESAQYLTVSDSEIKICGNIYYNSDVINGVLKEQYTVLNGNEATTYENDGGVWTKYTEPLTAEEAAEFTPKGLMANLMSFDAADYNIVDGVWTAKNDSSFTLKIVNGNIYVTGDSNVTISLKKFTLTLPEEAKNATEI